MQRDKLIGIASIAIVLPCRLIYIRAIGTEYRTPFPTQEPAGHHSRPDVDDHKKTEHALLGQPILRPPPTGV